jgi:hypothetical protein
MSGTGFIALGSLVRSSLGNDQDFVVVCPFDDLRAIEKSFGEGEKRRSTVISVEVMPPDYTNTERALRLNPRGALLTEWLATAAVPSPEWYAVDEAGQLGYVTSVGGAWRPESIRSSFEDEELVRSYFYNDR